MDQSADDILVCRRCGQGWQGAAEGDRCPNDDGGVLITTAQHHEHPTDPFLGTVIANKYAMLEHLGGGGFGAVYRARQEPVGRAVAVKVIAPDGGAAEAGDLRGRFFREARVVAQLNDPATVTLYDYGEEPDGSLFMVFEYIEGRLLAEVLHEEGTLNPERAVSLAQQILSALAEAHAMGLVHRDLKPGNLIVTQSKLRGEKVKVLDFGIAKVLGQDAPDDVRTREGIVLGTPRYMSPEQASDRGLDGRSDLYALGVMLYQMLSGRVPFDGEVALDILMAHIQQPVPKFEADAGVPRGLAEVVYRALAKKPEERFADAEEMSRALDEAMRATGQPMGITESQSQAPAVALGRPPRKSGASVPAIVVPKAGDSGAEEAAAPEAEDVEASAVESGLGGEDATPLEQPREPVLAPTEEVVQTPGGGGAGALRAVMIVVVAALVTGAVVIGGLSLIPRDEEPAADAGVEAEPVKVTFNVGREDEIPPELMPVVELVRAGETEKAAAKMKELLDAADDRSALLDKAKQVPELAEALRSP